MYTLIILLSVSGRVMVSGLPSLENQALSATVLAVVELTSRATMTLRDRIFFRVFCCGGRCRDIQPGYFSDPRKHNFVTDNIICAMIAE